MHLEHSLAESDQKPTVASRALFLMLCAAPVLAALAIGMVDDLSLGLFSLSACIVGWLWLADAWTARELRLSRSLLQWPLLGLILIGAIQLLPVRDANLPAGLLPIPASSALSLDAFATKLMLAQLAAMLVYFAAALTFINTRKRLQTVALAIVVFGFALAVFGVIQYFTSDNKIYWMREPNQATPFGPFVNRHHFAACMEMTMSLALGLLYFQSIKKEKRPLIVFAVLVMGVALIMTGSRGALIGLFGILTFLTATKFAQSNNVEDEDAQTNSLKRFSGNKAILLAGGIALILIVFGAASFLGSDELLTRSVGFGGGSDFSNGRTHFWATTLEIIRDYPIFGVGLDAFAAAYPRYDTWNGVYRLERAHNDYLQVFAETGVAGFILIIWFLAELFRTGIRVFRTSRSDRLRRGICLGALAGCLGIAVHSFFDFPLRTPSNLLMFLTLAALATVPIEIKISRNKKRMRK